MTQTVSEKRETHVNFCNAENHFSVLQRMRFAERLARIGYWELDLQSKRFYWSSEMYQIFGIKGTQISSRKNLFREQILPEDMPIYKQKIIELIKHQNPVQGEIRIRHLSGQIIYCRFTADIRGNRVAGTFQNISDWIHQLQVLQRAQKKAEDACRSKSYFLAQASHDLRQPMQALSMFISALAEEKLTSRQKMLLNKIEASAENLKSLLDNLLDLSKMEANSEIGDFHEFNIAELLKKICREYQETCQTKNISFRCIRHNAVIFSDMVILERLLRNLLSNAVKYTKNKIILGCKWYKNYLRIMVIDNGIGISAEEQEQIFDEFYQSKKIKNNRSQGSGLGLAIVRKSAELLGISVKLNSTPGQGSCFWFDIPILQRLPKIKK